MEFLNRAIAQITDLLRSMTPGARIATGLLLVLVPISLAYLFTYRNSSADDYLLNGVSLEPADMEAMQAAGWSESMPRKTSMTPRLLPLAPCAARDT